MKTFNQIINDSFEQKSVSDYTKTLEENQSFIAYKTFQILTENTDIDDADPASENEGVPFRSMGPGPGKYYLHVDVDGTRKLMVFDTAQGAKAAADSYENSSKELYNYKGDLVNIDSIGESFSSINEAEEKGFYDTLGDQVREFRRRGARGALGLGDIEALENILRVAGAFGPGAKSKLTTSKERDEAVQKETKRLADLQKQWQAQGFKTSKDITIPKEEIEAYREYQKQISELGPQEGPLRPGQTSRLPAPELPTAKTKAELERYEKFLERTQGKTPEQLLAYYEKNPEQFEVDEPLLPSKIAVEAIPLSVAENRPEGAVPRGIRTGTVQSGAELGAQTPEIAGIMAAAYAAPIAVGGVVGAAGRMVPAVARTVPAAAARAGTEAAISGAFALQGAQGLPTSKNPVDVIMNAAMLAGAGKEVAGGMRLATGGTKLPKSLDPMATLRTAIEKAKAEQGRIEAERLAAKERKSEAKVGAEEARLEAGAEKELRRATNVRKAATLDALDAKVFEQLPWLKYFNWGKKTPEVSKLPPGGREIARTERKGIARDVGKEVGRSEAEQPRELAKELTKARIEAQATGAEMPVLVPQVSSSKIKVGTPLELSTARREQESEQARIEQETKEAEKDNNLRADSIQVEMDNE